MVFYWLQLLELQDILPRRLSWNDKAIERLGGTLRVEFPVQVVYYESAGCLVANPQRVQKAAGGRV